MKWIKSHLRTLLLIFVTGIVLRVGDIFLSGYWAGVGVTCVLIFGVSIYIVKILE